MPKKRSTKNKGLPPRWRMKGKCYYYRVPEGLEHLWGGKTEFKLGGSLPAAYKEWALRIEQVDNNGTVAHLLDRYLMEVVPTKAPKTQKGNIFIIKNLRQVFGHFPIVAVKPKHLYQYMDRRKAGTQGKREIDILKHCYTKAVEWGYIDYNPMHGQVRIQAAKKAPMRYVEDWEIVEALSVVPSGAKGGVAMCQAFIQLQLITGLRKTDILLLREGDNITEDGICFSPSKTGGRQAIFEWTDALAEAVNICRAARPQDIAPYLFCNRYGAPYVTDDGDTSGFDSIWYRFMTRAVNETKLKKRFSAQSLRRKAGSDAESVERAMQVLRHRTTHTTKNFYRVKPEKVKPFK